MSIFDILGNGSLGSVIDSLAKKAGAGASGFAAKTPGGMGGLLGAGALGALLGNLASGDTLKNLGLIGAGAVAWNFYQKWAQGQSSANDQALGNSSVQDADFMQKKAQTQITGMNPVFELVIRSMIYAARADGNIDEIEKSRINAVIKNMAGEQDCSQAINSIASETIDPKKIALAVSSSEQAADIYRLSCAVIDIDHFMERSYLDALAKELAIVPQNQVQIEQEAAQAKKQLAAYLES